MTKTFRHLPVAVALSAVLLLAGCSGASTDQGSPNGAGAAASKFVEPIEAYFAAAENDWHAAVRAHLAQNQDKIASCMTEAGFEYTPSTLPPEQPALDKTTEEWISQHGYGLSPDDQKTQQLEDMLDTPYGVDAPAQTAYVAGLSDSESEAYHQALLGPDFDGTGGCSASQPIDPRFTPAAIKLAQDSFGYQDQAQSDPATVTAKDDWAGCMSAAGHDGLSEPGDAYSQISDLYNPTVDGGKSSEDKQAADDGSFRSSLSDEQLATIHHSEVALALADYDCQKSTKYRERTTAVLYALETTWIEKHKAELDDVIAGYRQASK